MSEIICPVCWRHCRIPEDGTGWCSARRNVGGVNLCDNYGMITSLALDPVEKKPFARFHPGKMLLSAGSYGCNMACPFCQNYSISQSDRDGGLFRQIAPDTLAELALGQRRSGCIGLAFTYNEPMISYEYVRDAARYAKEHGLVSAVVTNGCVAEPVLREVLPYVDAFNVDLKCFTPEGYRKLGGDLDLVRNFIATAVQAGRHVEVTTLVVPGISDSPDEIDALAAWLASLDPDIPLHLTRFFPCYRMTEGAPTDPALLFRLRETAAKHLRSVFLGNL